MKDGLYHRDIGMPLAPIQALLAKEFSLVYSKHAQRAVLDDRYGPPSKVPFRIWFDIENVVEVEIVGGLLTKIVVRVKGNQFEHRNKSLDLVLAIAVPYGYASKNPSRELYVKTLWLNDRTDEHATLDRTKYQTL